MMDSAMRNTLNLFKERQEREAKPKASVKRHAVKRQTIDLHVIHQEGVAV